MIDQHLIHWFPPSYRHASNPCLNEHAAHYVLGRYEHKEYHQRSGMVPVGRLRSSHLRTTYDRWRPVGRRRGYHDVIDFSFRKHNKRSDVDGRGHRRNMVVLSANDAWGHSDDFDLSADVVILQGFRRHRATQRMRTYRWLLR